MRSHSDDGINVTICIITDEIAMIQPYHSLEMEESLEQMIDAVMVERLVAMRSQQTL